MGKTETDFRRWRLLMQFTQDEAAAALGVSKSQVKNYDAGISRTSGEPAIPPLAVRKVMTMLIRGEDPQPWPDDKGRRK